MTRSWLSLPLLLVGALLLGQPALGAEEEQASSGEFEYVSKEMGEQSVTPSAEDEEEDLQEEPDLTESEESDFWRTPNSEEFHKKFIQMQRKYVERDAAYSAQPVQDFMKRLAVAHYNKYDWQSRYDSYYKHYEDSHFDVERAEGLIATFEMTLVKTNCTREDVSNSHEGFAMRYSNSYLESQGCVLAPESEQEKLECTFKIFIDDKNGAATVIGDDCVSVPGSTEESSKGEREEEEVPEHSVEPEGREEEVPEPSVEE